MDNISYRLAYNYVVVQLDNYIDERRATVRRLNECDCIPVEVTDSRGQQWDFYAATTTPGTREIQATYVLNQSSVKINEKVYR